MKKFIFLILFFFSSILIYNSFGMELYFYGHSRVLLHTNGAIEIFCDPPRDCLCCIVTFGVNSNNIRIYNSTGEGYVDYTTEPNTETTIDSTNYTVYFFPEE